MIKEPIRRISLWSKPMALEGAAERSELEQTSSPKVGAWCAGVYFCGFIS
jgi:hypothetical protein